MSYRYPHEDDSDENGFGENLQVRSRSSMTRDNHNDPAQRVVGLGEEIEDEDDDQDFHGRCFCASLDSVEQVANPSSRCHARSRRRR